MRNAQKRCHNCNETGHMSVVCQKPQRMLRCVGCNNVNSHHDGCAFNPNPKLERSARVYNPICQMRLHLASKLVFADLAGSLNVDQSGVKVNGVRVTFDNTIVSFYGQPTEPFRFALQIGDQGPLINVTWKRWKFVLAGIIINDQMVAYMNVRESTTPIMFLLEANDAYAERFDVRYGSTSAVVSRQNGALVMFPRNRRIYIIGNTFGKHQRRRS